MEKNQKRKILIATAFPTHGAGSGALVTTQAKSYAEDGHDVVIITGNNRTDFDKLDGVRYHIVPFTGETPDHEVIDGQVPFNYLMFTTHTESTANFWNVSLAQVEQYCDAFKTALKDEIETLNPDVIHAQHNWLLSSIATELDKPVVTTIHGTDLMGYEKAKIKLQEVKKEISTLKKEAKDGKENISLDTIEKVEDVYKKSKTSQEIENGIKTLLKTKEVKLSKSEYESLRKVFEPKKIYELYINEAEKSAKNSEKIIVISEDQKNKFASLFPYAAEKVVLLENGYDPKTFYKDENVKKSETIATLTSDRSKDGKIPEDFDSLVLFVGKFADFKGIDSLLIASKLYTQKLADEGKKVETIIVGSGALEDKLKKEADQLNLEHTHFVGRKPHDVIRNLQNLSTVSLIPSRDEPFGLVVIEGTACGHPVIGSNSGGIPGILNTEKVDLPKDQDIISTKLGLLVKPLPVRPVELTDEQKDELDVYSTDYVVAKNDEERKKVLKNSTLSLKLQPEVLKKYFDEYTASTTALADGVVGTVNKKYEFDNQEIASYTKNNYSQDIIRDKLFGIFDDAIDIKKKTNELDVR